jgi:hypothetical protein
MPQIGRNAKLYQERRMPAYMPTLRGPGPQIYLPDNPVNFLPIEPPLPAPHYLYNRKYVDGGKTLPWPSGNCGECNGQ